MAQQKYDLIIVGGGMIGGALAIALGNRFNLALIETDWHKPEPDGRVISLNNASASLLKRLGVWDDMAPVCPFDLVEVWEEGAPLVRFAAGDIAAEQLGFMAENHLILAAIAKRLKQNKNIDLIADKVVGIDMAATGARVHLAKGRSLASSLVIGADGVQSLVRQQAGIGSIRLEHSQTALVVQVKTNQSHSTTWQRFTPTGAQAFLPLPSNRASLIWYNSAEYNRQLISFSSKKFLAHLQQAFPSRLGDVKLGNRMMFPVVAHHSKDYVRGCVLLVGDAAHSFHPLAGQGANFGLMDVQVLSELLQQTNDICPEKLNEYQKRRYAHNLVFMLVLESLNYGFSNLSMQWLRSSAMNLTKLAMVRRLLIKEAEGDKNSLLASLYKFI